jgi:hypothetical protein
MKKKLFQKVLLVLATVLLISSEFTSFARNKAYPADVKNINVEFICTQNEQFIFKLVYWNENSVYPLSVRIFVNNKEEIFYNNYKENKIERIFIINNTEDIEKLSFSVRTKKLNKEFNFIVKTSIKKDVSVNRLIE